MKRKGLFSLALLAVMLVALTVPCFASDVFAGYRYDYSMVYTHKGDYSQQDDKPLGVNVHYIDVLAPRCVLKANFSKYTYLESGRLCVSLIDVRDDNSYFYFDYFPDRGLLGLAYWDGNALKRVDFDSKTIPQFADLVRLEVTLETDADRAVYSGGKYVTDIRSIDVHALVTYSIDDVLYTESLAMPSDISSVENANLWNNYLSRLENVYGNMIADNSFYFQHHFKFRNGSGGINLQIQAFPLGGSAMGDGSMLTRTIGIVMVTALIGGGVLLVVKLRSNRRRR